MASRTEGIALLSMYDDEEEDDDVLEEQQQLTPAAPEATTNDYPVISIAAAQDNASGDVDMVASPGTLPPSLPSLSPTTVDVNLNSRLTPSPTTLRPSPSPTRQPFLSRTYLPPYFSAPPVQLASGAHFPHLPGQQRGKVEPRGIVDYGHDEMAMSPEADDEAVTTEFETREAEPIVGYASGEDKYISAVISSPNQQTPPQSFEQLEISKPGFHLATNITAMEMNTWDVEVEVDVTTDVEDDLLSKFLPPPPTVQCSIELQEKINKFLGFKKTGKSFNSELRSMKAYRNPDFLQHAVTYQEINQIGTCFRKDIFDCEGFDRSDYYDAIEADMKRELERKEQERKRSPKVDFVPGSIQPPVGSQGTKSSSQLPDLATATGSGPQLTSAMTTDIAAKENRQNKKSKWDKVDTDLKNPMQSGGSDTASAAANSATVLSATNAGGGYTAFAQQKRREAEEKRTSERKLERRS